MSTRNYKSLGFKDLAFQTPDSVEAFDTNAGVVGACLAEASNNIIYRSSLATFRDAFLHGTDGTDTGGVTFDGIEKLTGVERLTEPVKDKEGKPKLKDNEPVLKYTESEEEYLDRVLATLVEQKQFPDEAAARSHFSDAALKLAAAIPFDAKQSERKAVAPKKLAKKYKDTAARILAAGNVDAFNANNLAQAGIAAFAPSGDTSKTYSATFEKLDPATKKGTGEMQTVTVSDKDAESLGWLVKKWSDWREQQTLLAV